MFKHSPSTSLPHLTAILMAGISLIAVTDISHAGSNHRSQSMFARNNPPSGAGMQRQSTVQSAPREQGGMVRNHRNNAMGGQPGYVKKASDHISKAKASAPPAAGSPPAITGQSAHRVQKDARDHRRSAGGILTANRTPVVAGQSAGREQKDARDHRRNAGGNAANPPPAASPAAAPQKPPAAQPVRRDPLYDPIPVVSDRRDNPQPVVRDHRDNPQPAVRDHRDNPQPVVSDHRDNQPVVRDHRGEAGGFVTADGTPVIKRPAPPPGVTPGDTMKDVGKGIAIVTVATPVATAAGIVMLPTAVIVGAIQGRPIQAAKEFVTGYAKKVTNWIGGWL